MSKLELRKLVPGLIVGLAPAAMAAAQDFPDPLPPLPSGPVVVIPAPLLLPYPTVYGSPRTPPPVDPIALERWEPKCVVPKSRSYHWRRLQESCSDIPRTSSRARLGPRLYDHGRTMTANGDAARLTLFEYDFLPGTDQLSPRGKSQLAAHAAQLVEAPYPLTIEPTPKQPLLAERRRLAILIATANWPNPIAPDRIVVAAPRPIGLTGINAQIVGANAMDRFSKYGPPIPILSNGVNSPSGVTGQ